VLEHYSEPGSGNRSFFLNDETIIRGPTTSALSGLNVARLIYLPSVVTYGRHSDEAREKACGGVFLNAKDPDLLSHPFSAY
jgi:hypothetical protein